MKKNFRVSFLAISTVWKYISKIVTYTLSVVFTLFIIAVITGVIMASALAIYVKNYIDPTFDIPDLQSNIELSTSLYYDDKTGIEGTPNWVEMEDDRLYASENRTWVSYDKIPTNLINAFIAIEDKRFRTHNGVDYRRTIGAFLELAKGNTSYGGSTITQQLIKNNTKEDQTTIQRKIQEILRALDLEKRRSKEEIMEMYLNTIYLSQGQYGVQSAAREYFGKDVSELSLVECAAIASITQYPTKWDPKQNPENNRERRNTVLYEMLDQGLITEEEYNEAVTLDLVLADEEEDFDANQIHSYFVDQVIDDVIDDLITYKGYTEEIAKHLVFAGGLKIYTTMDPYIQGVLEEVYAEENETFFPKASGGLQPESAMVIMDHTNGDIVGLVGGRGVKKINRGLNRATQSKRQPGSSMKPLAVYAPAIELGLLTYGSCLDDTPPLVVNNEPWPKNAGRTYTGHVSLSKALAYSYNTTAIRTYLQLGDEYVFNSLRDTFHISTLVDQLVLESGKVLTDRTPSTVLGGLTRGVTTREMTAAYAIFANRGIYSKPRTYLKVVDKDGNILLSNEGNQEAELSADTAAVMTRLLQNVVDYGTGAGISLKYSVNVAGKTGSTTDNKDLYFCGYTPYYTAGIWVGYDIQRTISNGSIANTVWDIVMKKVHQPILERVKNGEEKLKTFDENCSGLVQMPYCIDSGMKPGPNCALDFRGNRTAMGWFTKNNMPTKTCTAHVAVKWDFTTGSVAGENCPDECCDTVALVRENNRSFTHDVNVQDANYIYRDVPAGYIYPSTALVPFFQNLLPEGTNAGQGPVARPHNSYCVEHNSAVLDMDEILPPEEETPEDTPSQEENPEPDTSDTPAEEENPPETPDDTQQENGDSSQQLPPSPESLPEI
ncbi:MAG: PBP1A family penicillin-binding protein [Clostridia bacterium]|nr:PBP1A family penicillin-binding protein [Clostridia bacterium]